MQRLARFIDEQAPSSMESRGRARRRAGMNGVKKRPMTREQVPVGWLSPFVDMHMSRQCQQAATGYQLVRRWR